jgi:protein TonB
VKGLRWLIALAVAASLTVVELAAIAWMNDHGSQEHAEPTARVRSLPVIRPPSPKPQPEQATSPAAAGPNTSSQPRPAPPAPAPSALPSLADRHPLADVSSSLPGLSIGGDGFGLSVTDNLPTAEPERKASATFRPRPRYPAALMRRRVEGAVIVRMRVDTTGKVISAVVVSSEPKGLFDDAAIDAARRYRFRPARKGGKAIPTTVEQRIVFRIKKQ